MIDYVRDEYSFYLKNYKISRLDEGFYVLDPDGKISVRVNEYWQEFYQKYWNDNGKNRRQ